MGILNEVYVLEKQWENGEELGLAQAFDILKDHWENEGKDREISLHLIFLAWYGLAEPTFSTGFKENFRTPGGELQRTFHQVYNHLIDANEMDAECCFVLGLMASIFPYLLGDESRWEKIGNSHLIEYRNLAPNRIPSSIFENRGLYGKYFSHQLKSY